MKAVTQLALGNAARALMSSHAPGPANRPLAMFGWVFLTLLACRAVPVAPEAAEDDSLSTRRTPQGRHPPCDPVFSETFFVPDAGLCGAALGACPGHCGDGSRAWTRCTRTMTGGCSTPITESTQCATVEDLCDGSDLGGASCESLGFKGGRLGCRADCQEFDTRQCNQCPSDPTATCFQLEGNDVTVAAFTPTDSKGAVVAMFEGAEDAYLVWLDSNGPARRRPWEHGDVVDLVTSSSGVFALSNSERGPELFLVTDTSERPIALPEALQQGCARLRGIVGGALVLSDPLCGGLPRAAIVKGAGAAVPVPLDAPLATTSATNGSALAVVRTKSALAVFELVSTADACELRFSAGQNESVTPIATNARAVFPLGGQTFTSSGTGCSGRLSHLGRSVTLETPSAPSLFTEADDRRSSSNGRWASVRGNTIVIGDPK